MGLSMSYLKRAMAATVARWTESLQHLNKALQKVYNHDAMIDEHQQVSKLSTVYDEHYWKLVKDSTDREILRKQAYRIARTAERLKRDEPVYRHLAAKNAKQLELWAMKDKQRQNWDTEPWFWHS